MSILIKIKDSERMKKLFIFLLIIFSATCAFAQNGPEPRPITTSGFALINGSSTVGFSAKSLTMSAPESASYGTFEFPLIIASLGAGATKYIQLTRSGTTARAASIRVEGTGLQGSAPLAYSSLLSFVWGADGSITGLASSAVEIGLGSTIEFSVVGSGTAQLNVYIKNGSGTTTSNQTMSVKYIGLYAPTMTYSGVYIP